MASPERADGAKVFLYPSGSVRGRVVDASGALLPGQRVWAEAEAQPLCDAGPDRAFRRQDGGWSVLWSTRRPDAVAPFHTEREAFTDAAGAYVIDGIPCPAGGGEVSVALPGGRPRVTLMARPGEAALAADLVRPDDLLRRFRGVVEGEDGSLVAFATIELGGARTTSDARGRFDLEVPGRLQGELTLRAGAAGYVPCRRILAPSHGIFAEGDDRGLTITLARAVRLAVVVVDRWQRPVPDASVQVFAAGGLTDHAPVGPHPLALVRGRADDRGTVLLEVPPTSDVLVEYARSPTRAHRKVVQGVAAGAVPVRAVLDDLDLSR